MTVSYAQNSDRPQSIKKLKTSATDYRTRHYWLTPHGKNQPVRSNPWYESDTDVSDTRQTCRERNSEASTIKRSHPSKKRLLIENPDPSNEAVLTQVRLRYSNETSEPGVPPILDPRQRSGRPEGPSCGVSDPLSGRHGSPVLP